MHTFIRAFCPLLVYWCMFFPYVGAFVHPDVNAPTLIVSRLLTNMADLTPKASGTNSCAKLKEYRNTLIPIIPHIPPQIVKMSEILLQLLVCPNVDS